MADNPNAFPVSTIDGFTDHGMSLRDHFAGQALAGLLSPHGCNASPVEFAEAAFCIADAMLAHRAKAAS